MIKLLYLLQFKFKKKKKDRHASFYKAPQMQIAWIGVPDVPGNIFSDKIRTAQKKIIHWHVSFV